jgi:hypothetical protein
VLAGVLRDGRAWFKNSIYAAFAGVLVFWRIELVSGPGEAWEAALEKGQLLG